MQTESRISLGKFIGQQIDHEVHRLERQTHPKQCIVNLIKQSQYRTTIVSNQQPQYLTNSHRREQSANDQEPILQLHNVTLAESFIWRANVSAKKIFFFSESFWAFFTLTISRLLSLFLFEIRSEDVKRWSKAKKRPRWKISQGGKKSRKIKCGIRSRRKSFRFYFLGIATKVLEKKTKFKIRNLHRTLKRFDFSLSVKISGVIFMRHS